MKLLVKVVVAVTLHLCFCFNAEPIRRPRRNEAFTPEKPVVTVSSLLMTDKTVRDGRTRSKVDGAMSEGKFPVSNLNVYVSDGDKNDGGGGAYMKRLHNNNEEENGSSSETQHNRFSRTLLDRRMNSKREEIYQMEQPYKYNEVKGKNELVENIVKTKMDRIYEEENEKWWTNSIKSKVDEIYRIVQPYAGENEKWSVNNIESLVDKIYHIVQPYEEANEWWINNIESKVDEIYRIVQPFEKESEDDQRENESGRDCNTTQDPCGEVSMKGVNFNVFMLINSSNHKKLLKDVLERLLQNVSGNDHNLGEAYNNDEEPERIP
ncbi:hypothetical protein Y032_0002g744 [Ancylostoma ceylanicum]|uniref:SXP/RAL-2 family protein Ani s 5-like cation-binding domain-containing protein n=1 Tax=Ancylostoma ceylanicum TaxID=53326 RepID=A0A016W182_9BILA|nr:hypothetical protein Y032_0002g744 [Ancylostoma ceylanicum]